MIETKIDKSAVCTAFACAIAAFACGFAFCLAMLSNSGSCYFLIKDFLFSTRGYAWVQEIRALMGATVFDAAQIVLLILILFIAVSVVIVRFLQIFRKSVQESKTKREEQSVDMFPPFTAFENSIPQSESKNENNMEQAEEDKKTENNWEKLNSLSSEVLCRYLKCECPQVAAIVLEKLNSELSRGFYHHLIQILQQKLYLLCWRTVSPIHNYLKLSGVRFLKIYIRKKTKIDCKKYMKFSILWMILLKTKF